MRKLTVPFILFLFSSFFPAFGSDDFQVESHYHGATLFIGETAKTPDDGPVAVESFLEYLRVYGVSSLSSPDRMTLSAHLFFRNGGKRLYVASPEGESLIDYIQVLEDSKSLPVDLIAAPGEISSQMRLLVMEELAFHAEKFPHRFALLDAPKESSYDELITFSGHFNTTQAAMYSSWVVSNWGQEAVPSSAILAAVISRTDRTRGIYQTPAGNHADLKGILGLERDFSDMDAGELNLAGVNVLRFVEPWNGYYVWGARVLKDSSQVYSPYIAVHRFQNYLKYSIETSLESMTNPSKSARSVVREGIENFLLGYFSRGAFAGAMASDSYFVQCFSQENSEQAVSCDVGIALVRPAEFTVFRIKKELLWKAELSPFFGRYALA